MILSSLLWMVLLAAPCSANWVDPDSPQEVHTIQPLTPHDKRSYRLVFSDEFDRPGRTFRDGDDPRWTAEHKNDFTNNPLHYYSDDTIQTVQTTSSRGVLDITVDIAPKNFTNVISQQSETKEVKSGMITTWNKSCFRGGIIEFSVQLPGNPRIAGLWPAVWMMGNLARATYVNSTEGTWPFSTNVCDWQTNGTQRINSCHNNDAASQQPQRHFLKQQQPQQRGRGAPEIDLLEVMWMDSWSTPTYQAPPVLSASLQVAPGKPWPNRPQPGKPHPNISWYEPEVGNSTDYNTYFYGVQTLHKDPRLNYQTDAISFNYLLNDDFYTQPHKYRLEWEPPHEDSTGGYIRWYIDETFIAGVTGDDLQAVSDTEIPSEPMYLIANVAVSKDWGFPDAYFNDCTYKCWSCLDVERCACALPKNYCDNFPAHLQLDYVRVYQVPGHHEMGCSPRSRPTQAWIDDHADAYKLPNQDQPLKPIVVGGANCTYHSDCGTGMCSPEGTCQCELEWTGPRCLSHAGFDNSTTSTTPMLLLFGSIVLVLVSVLIAVALIWKQPRYERLPGTGTSAGEYRSLPDANTSDESGGSSRSSSQASMASYQNEANALPMNSISK